MQLVNSCGSIVRIASCGVAVVRHFGGIRFGRDLDGRTGDFIQLILSHRLSFLKDTFVIKIVKGIFDRMPSGHSCTCLFCQEIPFPGDRFPSGAECPFVLAALAKIVPGIFIFLPAGLPITVFIKIVNLIVDLFPLFLRYLLPERELRLELLFLTNALTAILGIIATVNGRTAVTGVSEVDWGALTGLIIMLAGGGLIGLVIYKYRRIKTNI